MKWFSEKVYKKFYFILFLFKSKKISFYSKTDLITFSEFRKAVTDNIYPAPTREQYNTIMNMAFSAGNITTKQELAMFLAQVLWESAGLQVINQVLM